MATDQAFEPLSWRDRLAVGTLLLVVVLLFYGPILATGRLLAPGDGLAQFFPQRVLAAASLLQGEIPFWTPFNFSGSPFLAALQAGVFFPGNALFLIVPPAVAMNLTVVLTTWLAGVTTFAFARSLAMPTASALVSALTFMMSGFLLLNVQFVVFLQAAALMPLLLWCVENYRLTGRMRYPATGCLVLAGLILIGHPQMVALSTLLMGAYAVFRAWGLTGAQQARYFLHLGLMVGLGIGLSALQLVPALDYIQQSQRQVITYAKLIYNTPALSGIPGLWFPSFMGSRSPTPLLPHPLWPIDTWRFWLQGYIGVGGWLLGLVALRQWRLQPQVLFWAGTAGFALLLALGGHTPLFRLWALLPVLNQMPYPHRYLLVFSFAMAIVAGWGMTALTRGASEARRKAVTLAGALLAVGAGLFVGAIALGGPAFVARTQPLMPAGVDLGATLGLTHAAFWLPLVFLAAFVAIAHRLATRPGRGPAIALAALITLDLGLIGYHNGYWQLCPMPPTGLQLPPDFRYQGRSVSHSDSYYPYYRPIGHLEKLAPPMLSALWGVRSLDGYDAFIFKRYSQWLAMNSAGHLDLDTFWSSGHHAREILGLSRVQLDAATAAQPAWQTRLPAAEWRIEETGEVIRYRRLRDFPRAWRPERVQTLPAPQVEAHVTRDPAFRPFEVALLETPVPERAWTSGTVEADTLSMNRIRLVTQGSGPGLVVVNEVYDPGWRAWSGGRELGVHRVHGLVVGVDVPGGRHTIELVYEPARWRMGLALSGLSLLLLVAWIWGARRWRRAGGWV